MKLIFSLLVVVVVLVIAATVGADRPCRARVYCARSLAMAMVNICYNDEFLERPSQERRKRNPIWPRTPRTVQIYETNYETFTTENTKPVVENPKSVLENPKSVVENPKSVVEEPKSVVESPKSVVEECCYQACCIEQMLKYCDKLYYNS